MQANTVSLEAQVAERSRKVSDYVIFINRLVKEYGYLVSRKQGTCNTHVVKTLEYREFSFEGEWGMSMMGGNRVRVWFKSPSDNEKVLVFGVYYISEPFRVNDCKVEKFLNESTTWSTALNQLVSNYEEVVADVLKIKEGLLRKVEEAQHEEVRISELRKNAERLGIRI